MKVKDATMLFVADDALSRKSLRETISELCEMERTPRIDAAIFYLQELEHIINITKSIALSKKTSAIVRFKNGSKVRYVKQKASINQQFYVGKLATVISSTFHHSEFLHEVEFEDGQSMNIIGRFLEEENPT